MATRFNTLVFNGGQGGASAAPPPGPDAYLVSAAVNPTATTLELGLSTGAIVAAPLDELVSLGGVHVTYGLTV